MKNKRKVKFHVTRSVGGHVVHDKERREGRKGQLHHQVIKGYQGGRDVGYLVGGGIG